MTTFKASDLFVGVVDLFAVVLPGVVLTLWAMPLAHTHLFGRVLAVSGNTEVNAILFVTAAIFLGHLAYGVGAVLEEGWEGVVDLGRRSLRTSKQRSDQSYAKRAAALLENRGHRIDDAESKRYCSILISERSERVAGEVERLYALARFFRSFSAVFLVILVAGGPPSSSEFLAPSSRSSGVGSLALVATLFVTAFVAYLRYRAIHAKAVFRAVIALFTSTSSKPRLTENSD